MTVSFSVNRAELEKKAKRMQKQSEEFKNIVRKIDDNCLSKLGIAWRSKDNQEYISRLRGYISSLDGYSDFIDEYIRILNIAIQKYDRAIQDAAAIASSGKE